MACSCQQKHTLSAEKAPKPIGPYSVAVKAAQFIFTSGQLGLNPETGNIVEGGIEAETRQALTNIKAVLESNGSGMDKVIKTTVFLRDINEFTRMNAVYGEFFVENPPARSALQVAALPKGGAIEIETVALAEDGCCCDCTDACDCDCDCSCGCDCQGAGGKESCDCHKSA